MGRGGGGLFVKLRAVCSCVAEMSTVTCALLSGNWFCAKKGSVEVVLPSYVELILEF